MKVLFQVLFSSLLVLTSLPAFADSSLYRGIGRNASGEEVSCTLQFMTFARATALTLDIDDQCRFRATYTYESDSPGTSPLATIDSRESGVLIEAGKSLVATHVLRSIKSFVVPTWNETKLSIELNSNGSPSRATYTNPANGEHVTCVF